MTTVTTSQRPFNSLVPAKSTSTRGPPPNHRTKQWQELLSKEPEAPPTTPRPPFPCLHFSLLFIPSTLFLLHHPFSITDTYKHLILAVASTFGEIVRVTSTYISRYGIGQLSFIMTNYIHPITHLLDSKCQC